MKHCSAEMEKSHRLSLVPMPKAGEPSALEARSDDELMLLARGGLERAFSVLIERHQARALRVALRYLGRESLAAEVAQDAFVEIFRALPQYQAHGKFPGYLYRVLLNHCHMTWRRLRAERKAMLFAAEDVQEGDEAELLLRERRRDLHAALGEISEKLRSVVLLRYSAGLSYEEIAETLDVPTGTVKRRLFDAMAKLRETLEGS
ncbi:MAG TPA: RNA polymerase sigma factor [Polyangiaceae bacterium]|nr:RNA polymerase sigma factor [Polyangiaceae bacterium]